MDFLNGGFDGFAAALERSRVDLLFFERFDETSDIWNFERHAHGHLELLYFLQGGAQIAADARGIYASLYDIVIYPAGFAHTEHLQINRHQEIFCVQFDIPGLVLPDVVHLRDEGARVKPLLESIYAEHRREKPCAALISHCLKAAALLIARAAFSGDVPVDPVERVVLYMRDHLSEKLSVERLAALIHVSPSYLSRIFRRRIGMSPIEYLLSMRIEAAKSMLAASDRTVDEIAEAVGFASPKYFSRAFKQIAGMSPRAFRLSDPRPR